jgi:antitoxin component YwqK of YwqJK toxin-antitoxin module
MCTYNKEDDTHEQYHLNGKIYLKSKYNENNQRDGIWSYYDEDGILTQQILYSNGFLVKMTEYYSGGVNLSYEANYKSSVVHGPWLGYHENGKLFIEMEYNNGKLSGFKKVYDYNGELCSISYCI